MCMGFKSDHHHSTRLDVEKEMKRLGIVLELILFVFLVINIQEQLIVDIVGIILLVYSMDMVNFNVVQDNTTRVSGRKEKDTDK